MKTIYLDPDFKCHLTDDGTMTAVETDYFDLICDTMTEGYRFVPAGQSWTRSDGVVFAGEMVAPWKDWRQLDDAQKIYEREQLIALREENKALVADMAKMVDEVYQSDIEILGI